MTNCRVKPNDMEKYIYLAGLQETDETLYYAVLMSDPANFLPLGLYSDGR